MIKIGVTGKEPSFLQIILTKLIWIKVHCHLVFGAGIITTNTAWADLVVLDPGMKIFWVQFSVFNYLTLLLEHTTHTRIFFPAYPFQI